MPGEEPLGSIRFFRNHRQTVNSAVLLFATAQALAADSRVIVDVGCGRGVFVDQMGQGRRLHDLRGERRKVIGLDVDPAAADNPVLDEFRLVTAQTWPLADDSVDLVVCDWVLEHVQEPVLFVRELTRVLRPGGAFLARTVSRYSPVAVLSRVIPDRYHLRVLARAQPDRLAQDVFPATYRMNSRRSLSALLDADYDWSTSAHPALESYVFPWPRLATATAAFERHLPRSTHLALLVSARLKS